MKTFSGKQRSFKGELTDRRVGFGREAMEDFIRPIPSRKAGKFGRIHAKSAIRRLVVGRDEAQQAICPTKPPESDFSGGRTVKWTHKASSGDSVFMNEGVLRETKKL